MVYNDTIKKGITEVKHCQNVFSAVCGLHVFGLTLRGKNDFMTFPLPVGYLFYCGKG